jgi:hypothetical protein
MSSAAHRPVRVQNCEHKPCTRPTVLRQRPLRADKSAGNVRCVRTCPRDYVAVMHNLEHFSGSHAVKVAARL